MELEKDETVFCTKCQCYQPMASFAFSQAISRTKSANLQCLQHAQYMLCPHNSCDYYKVLNPGTSEILSGYHAASDFICGQEQCRQRFSHLSSHLYTPYPMFSIKFTISLATVPFPYPGDRRSMLEAIQREFSREMVISALHSMRVPICDHYIVSSPYVLGNFDSNDIHVTDMWEKPSLYRPWGSCSSDGECHYCHALGVHSQWEFTANRRMVSEDIELYMTIRRSVPDGAPAVSLATENHARCHGMAPIQLERIREKLKTRDETETMAKNRRRWRVVRAIASFLSFG